MSKCRICSRPGMVEEANRFVCGGCSHVEDKWWLDKAYMAEMTASIVRRIRRDTLKRLDRARLAVGHSQEKD